MKRTRILIVLLILFCAASAWSAEGLIVKQSSHAPDATMERMVETVESKGLKVFARIDHAAGAQRIGQELRPTQLLIFGNPQGGTPFMQCAQTVGIDLPLKVLIWEDHAGAVWLGYNDPHYLAQRHRVDDCPVAQKLAAALDAMTDAALTP